MGKLWAWYILIAMAILLPDLQAQDSACLTQLVPCLAYTNSTKTPSSSCCDPLKLLIKSDPKCLCSLLGSNSLGQTGINMSQAQLLPSKCGEKVGADACKSSPTTKPAKNSASNFSTVNVMLAATLSIIFQFSWASIVIFS